MSRNALLCLPGIGTSASILKMQMRQIEKVLGEQYDFIYIDPTYDFKNTDLFENDDYTYLLSRLPPDTKLYQWGNFFKSQDLNDTFKQCFHKVRDAILANTNIVGLVSYSQGSYMQNRIVEEIQQCKDSPLAKQIKFVIYISFNIFVHGRQHEQNFKLYDIPSLHMMGPNDCFYSFCLMNVARFVNPIVIQHEYGHRVPVLTQQQIRELKAFCSPSPRL